MDHPREHHDRNDTPTEETEILHLLDALRTEQREGTLDDRTLRAADRRIRRLLGQMRGRTMSILDRVHGAAPASPLLLPTGLPPQIDARLNRRERMVMNVFLKFPGVALSSGEIREQLEAEDPAFAALPAREKRLLVIRAVGALRTILEASGDARRLVPRPIGNAELDADLFLHALEHPAPASAPTPEHT